MNGKAGVFYWNVPTRNYIGSTRYAERIRWIVRIFLKKLWKKIIKGQISLTGACKLQSAVIKENLKEFVNCNQLGTEMLKIKAQI